MIPKIEWYDRDGQCITITIGTELTSLNEKVINKALMIAMNYLLENLEPTEQESAE